jgi:hypothetical protein
MKKDKILPFEYEVTDKPITGMGGLPVFLAAAKKLGLEDLFNERLSIKLRKRGYTESELSMAIILSLIAGGEGLDDIDKIRMDQVVSGGSFPHSTTVGDFLRRFDDEEMLDALVKVQDAFSKSVLEQCPWTRLTLDIDATNIKAEGENRQGIGMSYNGIIGYQALAVFAAELGLLLAQELRPANTHPGGGAVDLLKHALTLIPEGILLHLRSDSACYSKEVVEFCEERKMTFTVTADMTGPLQRKIENLSDAAWHSMTSSEDAANLYYQPAGWPKPYRFIAVRRKKGKDLFGLIYTYRAFVTNIVKGKPELLIHRHRRHANVENGIKELKSGFSLAKMPCSEYNANRAWFNLGSIAHNLFIAVKVLFLPAAWAKYTIKTIRYRLIHIGGVLTSHERRLRVKISRMHPWLKDFIRLKKRIFKYA